MVIDSAKSLIVDLSFSINHFIRWPVIVSLVSLAYISWITHNCLWLLFWWNYTFKFKKLNWKNWYATCLVLLCGCSINTNFSLFSCSFEAQIFSLFLKRWVCVVVRFTSGSLFVGLAWISSPFFANKNKTTYSFIAATSKPFT